MKDLFSIKENVYIKKINLSDIDFESENFENFKELILANETKYPNIDVWFKDKVIPGLKSSQRSAYIGYINQKPIVSAVVKKDKDAKICHLKIGEDLQDYGLGDIFLTLMIFDIIKIANNVHFTLPEGLWEKKGNFFKSFGFNTIKKAHIQYRTGEDELICSSPINVIHNKILSEKLPKLFYHYSIGGYSNDINLVLSIHPRYIDKIFNGQKTVEIRRAFSTKWIGSKAILYSTSPSKEIKGYVTLKNILHESPENIWNKYENNIGVEKDLFDKYVKGKSKIYAIEFDQIKKYLNGIPISQIEGILGEQLHIPQSHQSFNIRDNWYKGISISTLLHSMHSESTVSYSKLINQLNTVLNNKEIVSY